MCLGKDRYRTEGDALAACARYAKRALALRPYKCPYCSGWHITGKHASGRA